MFRDIYGSPVSAIYDIYGTQISGDRYLDAELMNAIDGAETKVDALNGAKFAYLTDMHLSGEGQLMQNKNTVDASWSIAVLNEVCKRGLVEAVVIGGDLINAYSNPYSSTKEDAMERISRVMDAIDTHGLPLYVVKGNHDLNAKYDEWVVDATYPNRVGDAEWQSLTESRATGAVYNPSDKSGYFYADLSHGVRLAVWNQYTGDTIDSSGNEGNGTSNTEKTWMRDVAFDTSKTMVSLWHNPEYWATYEGMYPRYFADGGRYDGKDWVGGGKTICINSHNHADRFGYLYDGTMTQNVPNFNVRNCFAVTASTAGNVHIDEGLERACVSIFTIDTDHQHVYETRIGNGVDRDSEYCTR